MRTTLPLAIVVLSSIGVSGCGSTAEAPASTPADDQPPASDPPAPDPAEETEVESAEEEETAETEVAAESRYYTDPELEALGFTLAPQDALPTREMFGPDGPTPTVEDYTFVCGGEPTPTRCVCRRPLPCAAEGDCITFDENLRVFREALAQPDDRRVRCVRAEIGRCGDLRYFYFEGDIHRYEMRYFDARGVLVGQRNVTDYNEYCNHSADVRWMGRVPRCERLDREEIICGEADRPLRAPLEDLRAYTRR